MHRCTPWPAYAHRCAQAARAGAMSWPRPGHVAALWPAVSQRRWPYRGPVSPASTAVSWPRSRHSALSHAPLGQNTLLCIAIQFLQQPGFSCHDIINCIVTPAAKPLLLPRYTWCIATQQPSPSSRPTTIQSLYRDAASPQARPTFQPLCHDTNGCIVT